MGSNDLFVVPKLIMLLYESEQKYLKKIRNNNRVIFFLLQSTLLFYILETFCYHLRMRLMCCCVPPKGKAWKIYVIQASFHLLLGHPLYFNNNYYYEIIYKSGYKKSDKFTLSVGSGSRTTGCVLCPLCFHFHVTLSFVNPMIQQ